EVEEDDRGGDQAGGRGGGVPARPSASASRREGQGRAEGSQRGGASAGGGGRQRGPAVALRMGGGGPGLGDEQLGEEGDGDGVDRVVEEADGKEAEGERPRGAPEPDVLVEHVEEDGQQGEQSALHGQHPRFNRGPRRRSRRRSLTPPTDA